MHTPKVSVIVPVYGVEKYIERCAISLFEQTLSEMEFIFVDDCSPDRSICELEKVIDKYPSRKDNVTILHHKQNKGLPQARQTGISHASGEFIAHCDSDDWVLPETYHDLYELAARYNADIVAFDDIEYFAEDNQPVYKMFNSDKNIIVDNKLSTWLSKWSLCCKLIKRELYDKPYNHVYRNHGEDMALFCQLLKYSNRCLYVPKAFYIADKQRESISRVSSIDKEYRKFDDLKANVQLLENFYRNSDKCTINALMHLKFSILESLTMLFKANKTARSVWLNTYPEVHSSVLNIKDGTFSIKERIKYIMTRLHLYPFPI